MCNQRRAFRRQRQLEQHDSSEDIVLMSPINNLHVGAAGSARTHAQMVGNGGGVGGGRDLFSAPPLRVQVITTEFSRLLIYFGAKSWYCMIL